MPHKTILFLHAHLLQRKRQLLALRYQRRQLLANVQEAFTPEQIHQRRRRLLAVVLIPMLLASSPAIAAEEESAQKDTYNLAQIVEQIQQHNRIKQQYQLNLKLLDESHTKAKNTRSDLQSTLNTVYDKESDAYHSLSTVGKNQEATKQGMQQIAEKYKQLYAAELASGQMTPAELQNKIQQDPSYLALQAQMTTLTGMETSLNSGIVTAESSLEQLWDGIDQVDTTLRSLENKQDDVVKSQADWNEEVKLVTNLLVRKTITMEDTQALLEQKQVLLQKQLNVAKKQEEVGLSVPVKTKDIQISLNETTTQLKQVKDGVQLLKRQLNDLMGRPLDATLHIETIPETGYVVELPVYSSDLLKKATEQDYTLKTLQRDIDNYKEDAQDLKDQGKFESDTLKIYDLNIELSKVSIQNQYTAIDNDLKKLIDAVNIAGQTYEEKIDAWHNAQTKYEQNKKYRDVGLISPLTFQAAELEHQQAALTRKQAAYDYALARLEYDDFIKGIDLSIYEQYKGL